MCCLFVWTAVFLPSLASRHRLAAAGDDLWIISIFSPGSFQKICQPVVWPDVQSDGAKSQIVAHVQYEVHTVSAAVLLHCMKYTYGAIVFILVNKNDPNMDQTDSDHLFFYFLFNLDEIWIPLALFY